MFYWININIINIDRKILYIILVVGMKVMYFITPFYSRH